MAKKPKTRRFRQPDVAQQPQFGSNSSHSPGGRLPHRSSTPNFRDHPSIRQRFFLAIPRALLKLLGEHLNRLPWDEAEQQLEFEAADQCGPSSDTVGFWDGLPLVNTDVCPPTPLPRISEALAREMGWDWNQAKIDQQMKISEIRLRYFSSVARGYAGWLVTSPDFQQEQDNLLTEWASEIRRTGISGVGTLITAAGEVSLQTPSVSGRERDFAEAVRRFLVRWRLNELTAPSLPAPAKPLMAGILPVSISNHLMDMGGVFHIPDTFPIPSRDEFRGMLDETLHRGLEANHLEEWSQIVRAGNPAKNQIDRFARVRRLFHYWAILHDRYPDCLQGQISSLHAVFAAFFSVGVDSIRRDLRSINSRLGANWATSGRLRMSLNH